MKVHVLQHVPFEGLGSIGPWLDQRGAEISYTRFFANDPLPAIDTVDLLIAMGGPMSVNDETELPWLRAEKQFVRDALAREMPVLGVCLGAQLIASALGERVYPNAVKEIGWFPVQAVPVAAAAFRFPPACTVFHWHGETFDLPAGAVQLARSAGCEHQAFQLKDNVIGLQFHLETTPESAGEMIENCRHELIPAQYIQSEPELRAAAPSRYQAINALMSDVLSHISRVVLAVILSVMASPVLAQEAPLPKVRVVATGGTIAGEQREPGTLGGYDIKKSVNEIVSLIPNVQRYAQVETEQFSNVPSPSITPGHWLKLAQRINSILNERPDLSGIVVTHGTARLEETAFFLYLTIKSDRPVVIVGAQRPPTGISPDGPINLLSAIRVAASPDARGKGVTAVMDDRIISAREVTKVYARGGGFEGREMGTLGIVATSGVEFFYQPVRKHTASSDFDVSALQALPRVGISYSYSGAEGVADAEARAVIVTTTGFAPEEGKYYEALRKKGVIVATTFPSGEQVADAATGPDPALPPVIAVKHLMPTKARILMMLALTRTQKPADIQKIFDSYLAGRWRTQHGPRHQREGRP